ncbi:hypothetical protein PS710_02844 [Pseudomonas fluorescens]|uniref:Uncharacterized protein n=1 Tax=Pseudomonas fluorescens TaxID=294 RepID=A0A5E7CGD7_PSEFL|nr:hypothetical protein PS710_02844 [Pseudomonas fluorescens]
MASCRNELFSQPTAHFTDWVGKVKVNTKFMTLPPSGTFIHPPYARNLGPEPRQTPHRLLASPRLPLDHRPTLTHQNPQNQRHHPQPDRPAHPRQRLPARHHRMDSEMVRRRPTLDPQQPPAGHPGRSSPVPRLYTRRPPPATQTPALRRTPRPASRDATLRPSPLGRRLAMGLPGNPGRHRLRPGLPLR